MKHTPDKISELGENYVFVFGSNVQGIHGKGAALLAVKCFGAVAGRGEGHYGRSYAIPTRERSFGFARTFDTLSLKEIAAHVEKFLSYAGSHPELTFYVTRIGCGCAGYSTEDIAPMFAVRSDNVIIPEEFSRCLP